MLATVQCKIFHFTFYPTRNRRINICATVILTFVACGYETWYLTLRVFENLVLTLVLGLRGWKIQEDGENFIIRSYIICTCQIFLGRSGRMRWMGDAAHMQGEKCIQSTRKHELGYVDGKLLLNHTVLNTGWGWGGKLDLFGS
jgi:hypothetical protein